MVQEERFQLACDDGMKRLFILSHGSAVEPDELLRLQHESARVEVEYDDPAGVVAHTAHRLRREPRHERLR